LRGGRGPHRLTFALCLAVCLSSWVRWRVGAEGDGELLPGVVVADVDVAEGELVDVGVGWSAVGVGGGARHRRWL